MSKIKNAATASSWFANQLDSAPADTSKQDMYNKRIQRVEDAISLKESDCIPMTPMVGALPYFLDGATYKDSMYHYDRAAEALIRYYEYFQPDAATHTSFTSGRANELAQSSMIDWPGRPGTRVPDFSTHQVIERELMYQEEYSEFIGT